MDDKLVKDILEFTGWTFIEEGERDDTLHIESPDGEYRAWLYCPPHNLGLVSIRDRDNKRIACAETVSTGRNPELSIWSPIARLSEYW